MIHSVCTEQFYKVFDRVVLIALLITIHTFFFRIMNGKVEPTTMVVQQLNSPPVYVATPPMNTVSPYAAIGSNTGQIFLRRPASSENRMIIDFYHTSCCGKPNVLEDSLLVQVPPLLAAKGITNEEWSFWMNRFRDEYRSRNLSILGSIAMILSCVFLPCMYYKCINQQIFVKKFNEDINRELFIPRGMYFKTQSSSVRIENYYEETAWIAISLTKEDAEELKNHEHILYYWCGVHEECASCTRCTEISCCCCNKLVF
jgi:hypothetical protein